MKGKIIGGTLHIEIDINHEKLTAGEGLHWLPCDNCGILQKVTLNTVSCLCNSCFEKRLFEEEPYDYYEKYHNA